MQAIEIQNNLIKAAFNPAKEYLVLGCFVLIRDQSQTFIGQIINFEAREQNFAIIKLIFSIGTQNMVVPYNGAVPSLQCQMNAIPTSELLGLFTVETPIYFGEVAQQAENFVLDKSFFDKKTIICIEKQNEKNQLLSNFIRQLRMNNDKVLLIDCFGNLGYPENTLTAGKDFKLPLDYDAVNFIYENGLEDASGETKATIQEIFLEVQNYIKTLPNQFIPFETFKNVVDAQYEELELVELLLLKNKLLKYYDEGVFAQDETDFKSFENHITAQDLTILDLSNVEEAVQREMIHFVYSAIENQDKPIYVFVNLNDNNADKKLLKQIYTSEKAMSTIMCQYSFKYIKELKQLTKNVLMFAPIEQQNDFGGYNVFVNKLNSMEFVVFGESTYNAPFIVTLRDLSEQIIQTVQSMAPQSAQETVSNPQPAMTSAVEQVQADNISAAEEQQTDLVPEIQAELQTESQLNQEMPVQNDSVESIEITETNEPESELKQPEPDFIPEPPVESVPELIQEQQPPPQIQSTVSELQDTAEISVSVPEVSEIQAVEPPPVELLTPETAINSSGEIPGIQELPEQNFGAVQNEIQVNTEMPVEELTDDDLDFIQENLPENVLANNPDNSAVQIQENTTVNDNNESFEQIMQQQQTQQAQAEEILPQEAASTPIVPVYSAEVEPTVSIQSDNVQQGDTVVHAKYGTGVVEKLISYGEKTLYSINFEEVGRRLLDPNVTEIKKA